MCQIVIKPGRGEEKGEIWEIMGQDGNLDEEEEVRNEGVFPSIEAVWRFFLGYDCLPNRLLEPTDQTFKEKEFPINF